MTYIPIILDLFTEMNQSIS